jgi:ferric enterobactin receptor
MIKKTIFLLFFSGLLVCTQVASGKVLSKTYTLTGMIVEKNSKTPLEFSSISIYAREDSMLLDGGITDEKGLFSIKLNHTNVFLKIESIGCRTTSIVDITWEKSLKIYDIGIVELTCRIEQLPEVEVRSPNSTIMMKLDKRVFNVGKDLVSAGGMAEDILRNVPGVSVDIESNITLRGSSGVLILLNGRPSSLFGNGHTTGLRQIQANQIERIEIITNPSSRYEAEGTAGIINIILKDNQNKGLNGSVSANVGAPDNFGLGGNLNYHRKNFNWFTNLGTWYVNRPGNGSYQNQFFNLTYPDSTIYSNMDRTHKLQGIVSFIKVGVDYHFNAKNILLSSFAYRRSSDDNSSQLIYKDAYGYEDNIFLTTEREEKETEREEELTYFLTYKRNFAQSGHQLMTDFIFENKSQNEESFYEELFYNSQHNLIDTAAFNQLSNSEEGTRQTILKSDYIKPFNKEGKFECGFQSSLRQIGNNYRVRELLNNTEIPDTNFTNDFKYHETIHGLYANVGSKINKFSFQLGLRAEHSDVTTELLLTNESKYRKYGNLFPSAFFSYDLPKNNALQISYSRRIQRPGFTDLNPFFTLRDRRNIFRGNPNIIPELTDSYELGHVKYWDKGSLSSIAYFRWTDQVIKGIQRVDKDDPGRTITQTENLDFKRNFGVEFTCFFAVNKWWRLNGDVNLYHSLSQGSYEYDGQSYFVGGQSFSMKAKTISRVTLWNRINTQLMLSYEAPRTTTQGVNKSMTEIDFATSVDIFKTHGTVTLSVSDLFNTRRRRSVSSDETFRSEDNFLWQARSFILSFNYRFNQQKNQRQIYVYPKDEDREETF